MKFPFALSCYILWELAVPSTRLEPPRPTRYLHGRAGGDQHMKQWLVSDPCFLSKPNLVIFCSWWLGASRMHNRRAGASVSHTPNHSADGEDEEAGGGAQSAEDDPLWSRRFLSVPRRDPAASALTTPMLRQTQADQSQGSVTAVCAHDKAFYCIQLHHFTHTQGTVGNISAREGIPLAFSHIFFWMKPKSDVYKRMIKVTQLLESPVYADIVTDKQGRLAQKANLATVCLFLARAAQPWLGITVDKAPL